MSPAARRTKKVEQQKSRRNRTLSLVGLIVVLSMLLSVVVIPGTSRFDTESPTPTLSRDAIIATILASEPSPSPSAEASATATAGATATATPGAPPVTTAAP